MKILHLIDSLNPGGAERMAVGYANALARRGETVFLWSTRQEGLLKKSLEPAVNYHFLNRKGPIGLQALFRASKGLQENQIQIIHAHGTSYFFGCLLKWLNPSVKLVWHDHNGSRKDANPKDYKTLIFCSSYFDNVFAVNEDLVKWHQTHLKKKQSRYLPNFVVDFSLQNHAFTQKETKTIIHVANFRKPKNHINLIKAFSLIHTSVPEWKLILVGKQLNDDYSQKIHDLIEKEYLSKAIKILGERSDVQDLLVSADIGILSSDMEGLPMILLEYGLAGLPVVCTNVGYCREVVHPFGQVVPPNDPIALFEALLLYINNPKKRDRDARTYQKHIREHFTEAAVLPEVISIYKRLFSS